MKFKLFIFIIAVVSFSTLQAKDNIYFPYFELINLQEDYQNSTSKLLRDYINEVPEYSIILPKNAPAYYPTEEIIIQEAKNLNCKYYLLGTLNKIGDNVIVNFYLKHTENSQIKWNDRYKASVPEDLDPIMQNAANAMNANTKGIKSQSIYSVTNYDAAPLRQKITRNSFGVGVGGCVVLSDYLGIQMAAGAEVNWIYDSRTIMFQLSGGYYGFGSDINLLEGKLNVLMPLTDMDNSLYFGGSAGLISMTMFKKEGTSETYSDGGGLSLGASAGYLIGRSSSATFKAQIEYNFNFITIKDDNQKVIESYPSVLKLTASIYFGK